MIVVITGWDTGLLHLLKLFTIFALELVVPISFGIHLFVLGKEKRAILRQRRQHQERRNVHQVQVWSSDVDEAAKYTAEGSITVTHPTEFEPPTESEIDA